VIETRDLPAPVEPMTTMKPSEALRLGAMVSQQAFGTIGNTEWSCALGAIAIGYNWNGNPDPKTIFDPDHPGYDAYRLVLPDTRKHREKIQGNWPTACPVHGCLTADGHAMLPHLNDDHRWSRNRIADWLETQGL
jgi:hypothetical protein